MDCQHSKPCSHVSESLGWNIVLTFEYVVVGIPPTTADRTLLTRLCQCLLHDQRCDSDLNGTMQ